MATPVPAIKITASRSLRRAPEPGLPAQTRGTTGINPAQLSSPLTPGEVCRILIFEYSIATVDAMFRIRIEKFVGPSPSPNVLLPAEVFHGKLIPRKD